MFVFLLLLNTEVFWPDISDCLLFFFCKKNNNFPFTFTCRGTWARNLEVRVLLLTAALQIVICRLQLRHLGDRQIFVSLLSSYLFTKHAKVWTFHTNCRIHQNTPTYACKSNCYLLFHSQLNIYRQISKNVFWPCSHQLSAGSGAASVDNVPFQSSPSPAEDLCRALKRNPFALFMKGFRRRHLCTLSTSFFSFSFRLSDHKNEF